MPIKKKTKPLTKTQKQKKFVELAKEIHTNTPGVQEHVFSIFLVRQGLRGRTEQFIGVTFDRDVAIDFCRTTKMEKNARENEKLSLLVVNPSTKENYDVNYAKDLLLIKGIDFTRRDEGRVNSCPLWYWNIAEITVFKSHNNGVKWQLQKYWLLRLWVA